MNQELADVKSGFRTDRGTRDEIAKIHWIIKKAREFQKRKKKKICLVEYVKAFEYVNHIKLWKILKEMGVLCTISTKYHLTCLLRNLYISEGTTIKTRYGKMDCFKIGKGVQQSCMLSPYLFIFYAVCACVCAKSLKLV